MNWPVSHLIPSVQTVAVCAKQSQIALVRRPIAEAVIPYTGAPLVPELLARVDMIDVQHAEIGLPAHYTGSTKFLDQGELPAPVRWVLVGLEAVFVPMRGTTLRRAKTVLALCATSLACALPLPSRFQVARPATVFPRAILEPIEVCFERLLAVSASYGDSALFHVRNISSRVLRNKFDIACKRIEDAQRQGDFFIGGAAA
jgi:hypothetical protein